MGSSNVNNEYQKPTKELNTLLLNTLEIIVNEFGTINLVTE
jgi:hypothetical protein